MKRKGKDKLFDNLPACAAEFIKLVIKKMRYRKKVRADVQAELIAHFEDALKDCATDEEKEQKAEKLIADFGDAKLLGVLARRAKKRCRPLWRTAVIRTFQAIGLLFVFLVICIVWFLTGRPSITTDYVAELNRLVRPVADEDQNAAPYYDKAIELYKEPPAIEREYSVELPSLPRPPHARLRRRLPKGPRTRIEKVGLFEAIGDKDWIGELGKDEISALERWVSSNAEALRYFKQASKKPYYWQHYESKYGGMMGVPIRGLFEIKNLGRCLCWRARFRAEEGQFGEAFEDILECYQVGAHLKGDKARVEQAVGIGIENYAVNAVKVFLSEKQIGSQTLAKFQSEFEKLVTNEDFIIHFEFEKLTMYDEIQRCFTGKRLGGLRGGGLYLEGLQRITSFAGPSASGRLFKEKVLLKPLHILFTHPDKYETRKMADHWWAFWEKMVRKSPAQIRAENIDLDEQVWVMIKGNVFLEILTPAMQRINEGAYRNKAESESLLAIIALLRYKQNTGVYPENLGVLISAGYLKELPLDPYSDKPLVYRKTDNDFTVYSVGRNFIDDGGKMGKTEQGKIWMWADNGDWVFWPVAKPK